MGAGGAGRALAFGAKIRGANVVIFDIDFGRTLLLITLSTYKCNIFCRNRIFLTCPAEYSLSFFFLQCEDRAKSLAAAVSATALPFEDLHTFQPEKDAILANATPLGMHPHVERRIPVAEVSISTLSRRSN